MVLVVLQILPFSGIESRAHEKPIGAEPILYKQLQRLSTAVHEHVRRLGKQLGVMSRQSVESAFQIIGHDIDIIQAFHQLRQLHAVYIIQIRSRRNGKIALFAPDGVKPVADGPAEQRKVVLVGRGHRTVVGGNTRIFPIQIDAVQIIFHSGLRQIGRRLLPHLLRAAAYRKGIPIRLHHGKHDAQLVVPLPNLGNHVDLVPASRHRDAAVIVKLSEGQIDPGKLFCVLLRKFPASYVSDDFILHAYILPARLIGHSTLSDIL